MSIAATDAYTLGSLDTAPGGNGTRILAAAFTLDQDISDASFHSVTADGVITNTGGNAVLTQPTSNGFGGNFTFEVPIQTADTAEEFVITFGDVGTTARTASALQMDIVAATVSCVQLDDTILKPALVGVTSCIGNQIKFAFLNVDPDFATDTAIANGDNLIFNIIAFAQPVHA
jgi:hypothetical protein